MTYLTLIEPGMATGIQDLGRMGFQSQGYCISGAMDQDEGLTGVRRPLVDIMLPEAAPLEVMRGPGPGSVEGLVGGDHGLSFVRSANGWTLTPRRPFVSLALRPFDVEMRGFAACTENTRARESGARLHAPRP